MRRETYVLGLSLALFAATAAVGVLVAPLGSWDLWVLLILAPLIILGDIVEIELPNVRVTGSSIGLLIAGAILGPTPVWLLATLTTVHDLLRRRPRPVWAGVNLAAYGVFTLVCSLVIRELAGALGLTPKDAAFALAILAGATCAVLCNFLISATAGKIVDGDRLSEEFRRIVIPLIPSEVAMVLLAGIVVFAYATPASSCSACS